MRENQGLRGHRRTVHKVTGGLWPRRVKSAPRTHPQACPTLARAGSGQGAGSLHFSLLCHGHPHAPIFLQQHGNPQGPHRSQLLNQRSQTAGSAGGLGMGGYRGLPPAPSQVSDCQQPVPSSRVAKVSSLGWRTGTDGAVYITAEGSGSPPVSEPFMGFWPHAEPVSLAGVGGVLSPGLSQWLPSSMVRAGPTWFPGLAL